jgi:hypothetical protein
MEAATLIRRSAMHDRSREGGLFLLPGLVALGIVALASVLGAASSGAQQGAMDNCPQAGRWAVAVWNGDDGTAINDALATCGENAVSAAYYLDPQTGGWLRWFPGRPDISSLTTLNNLQGVIALGGFGSAMTPTPSPRITHCPLPEGVLLHPPPPEVPYPSPPPEVASGLLIFRVTHFDGTPLPDSRVSLRFVDSGPSGVAVLTDEATRLTDSEGKAVFDARGMLPPDSWMIRELEECNYSINVMADVEVQVGGNILQFQAGVDLPYGALFVIHGAGRPYESGPYVPLPTIDWDESWLYRVGTPPPSCPSSWEASMKASVLVFRPALLERGDCQ